MHANPCTKRNTTQKSVWCVTISRRQNSENPKCDWKNQCKHADQKRIGDTPGQKHH